MSKRNSLFFIGLVVLVGLSLEAQMPASRPYDPATVETLTGTVEEVKLMSFGRAQMGGGVHLLLKTEKETLEVHLGPRFYLEENEFAVEPGEKLQVTGSRVMMGNQTALLARELQLGDYRLELRTEDGTPLWAGQGPGAGRRGQRMRGGWGCGHCCGHGHHCCGWTLPPETR